LAPESLLACLRECVEGLQQSGFAIGHALHQVIVHVLHLRTQHNRDVH